MNKTVLFLCTGNSCRSQMAEGWLRTLAGDRFRAMSAGTKPEGLHPQAVQVMQEIGIDISQQRSKDIAEFADVQFDYVVTVCDRARDSCPVLSGTESTLHWTFEDPALAEGSEDMRLTAFRRVRDEIGRSISEFVQAAG